MPDSRPPGQRTALVVGAAGGFGSATAQALLRHGWTVRALARRPAGPMPQDAPVPGAIQWIQGDALREQDVAHAAAGASLIVHAVNPPYPRWPREALPMLRHSIEAARAAGARILFPGNVYNFGPDAGVRVAEDAPQHPTTRKGALRVRMEQMLVEAAGDGVRSLVLRAGDFFGPQSPGSWLPAVMVKPNRPVSRIVYPGRPEAGHAWAYLPDLAETAARLADAEHELAPHDTFHFGGHWIDPGIEMAHAIQRVLGEQVPVRPFSWTTVRLASPFVPFLRELLEMRYLWEVPLRLDNHKFVACMGSEPRTPLDQALATTLAGLGVSGRAQETERRARS